MQGSRCCFAEPVRNSSRLVASALIAYSFAERGYDTSVTPLQPRDKGDGHSAIVSAMFAPQESWPSRSSSSQRASRWHGLWFNYCCLTPPSRYSKSFLAKFSIDPFDSTIVRSAGVGALKSP